MTKIKSLTLSNVRRFSENAKIKFGEGATIIVAPNGTGKTSIFEAIELVVTEKISRLEKLGTFVRDKQGQAKVEVEFSCSANKSVCIKNNGKAEFSGDLERIINGIDSKDLPFLLRLTHMLDQRGSDWFVQSDNAGYQLNSLPIGRDAAIANKLIPSVKRAAKIHRKDKNRDLQDAQNKLDHFKSLLENRLSIGNTYSKPLVSIEELMVKLNEIANSINYKSEITSNDIDELTDFILRVRSYIEFEKKEKSSKKNHFLEIKPIIEKYSDVHYKLKIAKEEKGKTQSLLELYKENLNGMQLEIAEINSGHINKLEELNLLKAIQERIQVHDKLKFDANYISGNINAINLAIVDCVENEEKLKNECEHLLKLKLKEASIKNSLVALDIEKGEINQTKDSLLIWTELHEKIIYKKKINEEIDANFSLCLKKASLAVEEQNKVKAELEKEELHLTQLTQTTDAIRSAVSIIASELPNDQDDCPVCGEHHGFLELKNKIGYELEKINPSISIVTSNVEKIRTNLKTAERFVIECTEAQEKAMFLVSESKNTIDNLELKMNEFIDGLTLPERFNESVLKIQGFLRIGEVQGAKSVLEILLNNVIKDYSDFSLQKKSYDFSLVSDYAEVKEDLKSVEYSLRDLKSNRDESVRLLENSHIELEKNVITESDRSKVKRIGDIERQLIGEKTLKSPIQSELDIMRSKINQVGSEDKHNQLSVDNYLSMINKIKVSWESLGFFEEPDLTKLESSIKYIDQNIIALGQSINDLNSIQTEVSRWNENAMYRDIQKRIDDLKGEVEEAEFLDSLSDKYKSLEEKLSVVDNRIKTLDTFSKKLSEEMKNVDGRIKEIEPVWRSLLSRIVLDSRYSKTGLSLSTRYNKPVATISAPLHDGVSSVNTLASEAQITDLQLTFLMAMAQKQNWSPWKALLLDDPTQHHDLVHSSSVFDLLRDFIVEENFQIVLTTHDKVQANFLKRKLENDGVPVTICHLLATEDGVVTKQQLC